MRKKKEGMTADNMFTNQADGAWPKGARVMKTNSRPGDGHPDGATGTVTASHGPVNLGRGLGAVGIYGYFIKWDDCPGAVVFVAGHRLLRLTDNP